MLLVCTVKQLTRNKKMKLPGEEDEKGWHIIFLKFNDSPPTPWCLCFTTPILHTLPLSLRIQRNRFDMKNLAAIVLAVSCAMPGVRVVDADDDGTCAATTSWTNQTAAAASGWLSVTFGNGLFVAVAYDQTATPSGRRAAPARSAVAPRRRAAAPWRRRRKF